MNKKTPFPKKTRYNEAFVAEQKTFDGEFPLTKLFEAQYDWGEEGRLKRRWLR